VPGKNRITISFRDHRGEFPTLPTISDGTRFIDCYHEKPKGWTSLIHLAQTNASARELLVEIAKCGFLVYRAPELGTQFVHRSAVSEVWKPLINNEYRVSRDGVVYRLARPRHDGHTSSLVVVFSSVAANRFSQLLDRNFASFMPSLESVVGGHTAVLRIADLDGVVGGYYLPTASNPRAATNVQNLMEEVAASLELRRNHIVTLGGSKGGTGALWHAIAFGSHCVAIDPIITHNRRSESGRDPYFVCSSIFPRTFDSEFDALLTNTEPYPNIQRMIITSKNSAEYPDISRLARRHQDADLKIVESLDPHITHHANVARNSMAITLALVNSLAQGLPISLPSKSQVC